MERIILDVVILEGHHEGDESLRWNLDELEQISTLEGRVSYAGQRSIVTQLAYPEDVHSPFVDFVQQLYEATKRTLINQAYFSNFRLYHRSIAWKVSFESSTKLIGARNRWIVVNEN